jgi:hypothetical protein
MDLDSGGPKTYRSGGSGSATLVESQHPDQGFRMNNPDHIFYRLKTIFFWLKYFNSLMRIRDGDSSDPGWKKLVH